MRKKLFLLFPLLLLIGCEQQTISSTDTQLSERNSYVKQFCLDKKMMIFGMSTLMKSKKVKPLVTTA